MNTRSSHRRAFSRTEAVAVCGVALLSAVALWPVLAQGNLSESLSLARENARSSTCQSNLRQISLGFLQYQQDYDELMPPASTTNHAGQYGGFGWGKIVQPYIKNTQIYQCPSEKHPGASNPDMTKPGYTDYWMNTRVSGLIAAKFKAPSQTLLLGDGDGGSPQSTARYNIGALPSPWRTNAKSPARRHMGAGNYAFADGHVKRIKPAGITSVPLAQTANSQFTFSPR